MEFDVVDMIWFSTSDIYLMNYVSHGVIFGCSSSVHYVVDVMKIV